VEVEKGFPVALLHMMLKPANQSFFRFGRTDELFGYSCQGNASKKLCSILLGPSWSFRTIVISLLVKSQQRFCGH